MDLRGILSTAGQSFLDLDYTGALGLLTGVRTSLQDRQALPMAEAEACAAEVLAILKNLEPVHARFLESQEDSGGFVVYPGKINKMCAGLLEELGRLAGGRVPGQITGLVYYYYHRRDLDQALALMDEAADGEYRDDLDYHLIKTRCLLLADRAEAAQETAARALAIAPESPRAADLAGRARVATRGGRRKRLSSARWPGELIAPADLGRVVTGDLLTHESVPRGIFPRSGKIAAIGSCFALNIVNALQEQGIAAYAFPLGEEINSTAANLFVVRSLIEMQAGRPTDPKIETLVARDMLRELAEQLQSADGLIITLGVSQAFFDLDGSVTVLKGVDGVNRSILKTALFRRIGVAENVANIRTMIAAIRELNPGLKVVLTLSPVPLARTFASTSAIMDDCLSKSTLRVAAAEVLEAGDGVYYWPSFEVAKWLAPHMELDATRLHFGADDHYSRHVTRSVVAEIVRFFIETAFAQPASE